MGKAGKLALAELRSMEKTNKSVVTLSEVQSEAMHNLLERYEKGVPRSLKMERTQLPCVVFTDGACEHVPMTESFAPLAESFSTLLEKAWLRPLVLMSLTVSWNLGKMHQRFTRLLRQKCIQSAWPDICGILA